MKTTETTQSPPSVFTPLLRFALYLCGAIIGVVALYFLGVHNACSCGFTVIDFAWGVGIFGFGGMATLASIELNIANGRRPAASLVVASIALVFSFVFAVGLSIEEDHFQHPDRMPDHPLMKMKF